MSTVTRLIDSVVPSKIRAVYASAPPDAIDLGLGMPYCPTPVGIQDAAIDAIRSNKTFYMPNQGLHQLRESVADNENCAQKRPVSADRVLITTGASEGIFVAMHSVLRPGDSVLIPDPGYPAYVACALLAGAKPVPYVLRSGDFFSIDSDTLLRVCAEGNVRMIVINSPSNPTGMCHSPQELQAVAAIAEEFDITVLSDDSYAGLYFGKDSVPHIGAFIDERLLMTVSGVSKTYGMTGWRVGWLIAPENSIGRCIKYHAYMMSCVASISQYAALAALEDDTGSVRDAMHSNREYAVSVLRAIPFIWFYEPDGGLYLFADVSRYGSGDHVAALLRETERTIVIPGSAFGESTRHFIRISYGAAPTILKTGLERLQRFFYEHI